MAYRRPPSHCQSGDNVVERRSGRGSVDPVARFWATGVEYLNDHQELVHGLKFVRETLTEFIAEFRTITYRSDEPHYFVNIPGKVVFLEHLLDGITAVIDGTYPYSIHCYVTSFSTESDLLSQWRGYGAGLDGYALAINPAGLSEQRGHPLRPGGHFAPVHYGPWRLIEPGYTDGASYRTRGTTLMPYTIWNVTADRIMGVKVGPSPTQKQNVHAVRGFLYRNGCVTAAENVTWSDTPFR